MSLPGHDRYSVRIMSATRYTVPGVRSKEGDQTLKPATRNGLLDWPSLVMEVWTLLLGITLLSDHFCPDWLFRKSKRVEV